MSPARGKQPRRFLIDTDTASDDAVALIMALREPDVVVDAITVVAGNVPLDLAVQNALFTVELCGADTPVYAGSAQPLLRDLETAQDVHGLDGMGDIGLPLAGRAPTPGRAVETIIDTVMAAPGEVTLVMLGPLTNLALALSLEPGLAHSVGRCVVMGGTGSGTGNVTPLGEFNFWCDPEAAAVVLRSPLEVTLVGWDISVASATFNADEASALRSLGTPHAEFAVDIQGVVNKFALEQTKLAGFDLPDPIAMAVALEPDIAEYAYHHVEVLTGSGPERGHDVVDWLDVTGRDPTARIVTHVPRSRFLAQLDRLLGPDPESPR